MGTFTFIGYLDNNVIWSGWMFTVYQQGASYFFHECAAGQKTISSFTPFEPGQFKNDPLKILKSEIVKKVGDTPVVVLKSKGEILYGSLDDEDFISSLKTLQLEGSDTLKKLINNVL